MRVTVKKSARWGMWYVRVGESVVAAESSWRLAFARARVEATIIAALDYMAGDQ